MKLLKINKNNSIYFQLSDGRLGITYKSGYVRVNGGKDGKMLYPINKRVTSEGPTREILLPSSDDRIKLLFAFNQKNCI